jgi:hypothetical protein
MKITSWPFSFRGTFRRLPVMVSMSVDHEPTMSLKACGWMPRWLPVRVQFGHRLSGSS